MNRKILTVTMNPAIDKTVEIPILNRGGLNRINKAVYDAGGKGINVSRTVQALGGSSIATGFLGGSNGKKIAELLEGAGIPADFVWVDGETRTNTKVFEQDGTLTELNEPGPEITEKQKAELFGKISAYADENTLVVLSGSVPGGLAKGVYRTLIGLAHEKHAKVLLDADGELFRQALEAKPDMIKPNLAELTAYVEAVGKANGDWACKEELQWHALGESLGKKEEGSEERFESRMCTREAAVLEIAEYWRRSGIPRCVVSMGRDGAVFSLDGYQVKCPALEVRAHSTVGAGDAMVAALSVAWQQQLDPEETVRLCMAASAGAVTTVGTKPPSGELVGELMKKVEIQIIQQQAKSGCVI